MKKKVMITGSVIAAAAIVIIPLSLYFLGIIDYAEPVASSGGNYVFCYFV